MASSSHFSNEATEGAAVRLAAETETPKPIASMAAIANVTISRICPPWFWAYLMSRKKIAHGGGPGSGLTAGASLRKATLIERDPAHSVCAKVLTFEIF
jgi:hypothetical protein